jgi:hypothetical protein
VDEHPLLHLLECIQGIVQTELDRRKVDERAERMKAAPIEVRKVWAEARVRRRGQGAIRTNKSLPKEVAISPRGR